MNEEKLKKTISDAYDTYKQFTQLPKEVFVNLMFGICQTNPEAAEQFEMFEKNIEMIKQLKEQKKLQLGRKIA